MSFANEPSNEAISKIVEWLRSEVSSYVLLHIGIQPSIIAGCTLRTTNKVFDFSMRSRIVESKAILREEIRLLRATS